MSTVAPHRQVCNYRARNQASNQRQH